MSLPTMQLQTSERADGSQPFFAGLSGNFSHLGQVVHHSDSLSAARVVQTPAAPPVRARTLNSLSGRVRVRGRGNVGGWNVADDSFQAAKLSARRALLGGPRHLNLPADVHESLCVITCNIISALRPAHEAGRALITAGHEAGQGSESHGGVCGPPARHACLCAFVCVYMPVCVRCVCLICAPPLVCVCVCWELSHRPQPWRPTCSQSGSSGLAFKREHERHKLFFFASFRSR